MSIRSLVTMAAIRVYCYAKVWTPLERSYLS